MTIENSLFKILDYRLDHSLGQKVNIADFFSIFREHGIVSHLCGGVVRDLLRDQPFNDIDFTFRCHVDVLRELIISYFGDKVIRLFSSKSGIIKLGENPFKSIDLTMYRDPSSIKNETNLKDVVYHLGDSLVADARNRDLSINCLYWDPYVGLQDPLGFAIDDVFAQTIQVIASPEKAAIDTRICFRILLFMSRGFNLNNGSEAFLYSHLEKSLAAYDDSKLSRYLCNLVRGDRMVAALIYSLGSPYLYSTESIKKLKNACFL